MPRSGGKRPRSGAPPRPFGAAFAPGEFEALRADEELRAALLADRARREYERLNGVAAREQERAAREAARGETLPPP